MQVELPGCVLVQIDFSFCLTPQIKNQLNMEVSHLQFSMYQLLREKGICQIRRRTATFGPKSCARANAFQGGVRRASRTFELLPASSPLPANTAPRQHKLAPLPRAQKPAYRQTSSEFYTSYQRSFSSTTSFLTLFTDQRARTKATDPKMDVQLYVYDLSQVSEKGKTKLRRLTTSGSCT
jgi:hypothetical protein